MRHQTASFCVAILLLIILGALTPLTFSVDWSPDLRITWKKGIDSQPSMTQTSDGRIWVVWQSDTTGNSEIFYKVYNKSAVHPWSQDMQLTNNPQGDFSPSIMEAPNGTIWVVWTSNRTGNFDIYYMTHNGSTWSPDNSLISDPSVDVTPFIMKTADSKIWVFWSSNRLDENPEIYYQTSSNGGQGWTVNRLTENDRGDLHPSAMQAANGTVWVVWRHGGDIYYQLFNGTSWLSADVPLVTGGLFDKDPSITQAADGTIWVVWHSLRNDAVDDIYYKTYATSWSADTPLTTDPFFDLEASALGTADGRVWIIWESTRADGYDLYYRTDSLAPTNDVSIFSVEPNQTVVSQGKNTSIEVVAQNKGTVAQTFNVKCYANSILIGTKSVTVDPGQLSVSQFQWNTTTFSLGTYSISAKAELASDSYTTDNTYVDGTITIVKHDVAIKSVTPSETVAQQGYKLQIFVVIKNEGNFTEDVTVMVYFDSTGIGPQTRTGLAPNTEATMTFNWTPTVPYGDYLVKVTALKVPDEIDLGDNSKTDGTVTVTIPGDVNGDHIVNIYDIQLIANHFNSVNYDANLDVQNDGVIDVFDIFILSVHVNQSW